MIRCRITITAVLCFLTASLHANPILSYDAPVISEVQWIDNLHWNIEISMEMWEVDIQPGSSTDAVRRVNLFKRERVAVTIVACDTIEVEGTYIFENRDTVTCTVPI